MSRIAEEDSWTWARLFTLNFNLTTLSRGDAVFCSCCCCCFVVYRDVMDGDSPALRLLSYVRPSGFPSFRQAGHDAFTISRKLYYEETHVSDRPGQMHLKLNTPPLEWIHNKGAQFSIVTVCSWRFPDRFLPYFMWLSRCRSVRFILSILTMLPLLTLPAECLSKLCFFCLPHHYKSFFFYPYNSLVPCFHWLSHFFFLHSLLSKLTCSSSSHHWRSVTSLFWPDFKPITLLLVKLSAWPPPFLSSFNTLHSLHATVSQYASNTLCNYHLL